jgi:NADH:ubiquinone oxidoreductase subunit 6 (subunit J)
VPSRWRPRQRWGAGLLLATLALLALVAVVAEGTPLEAEKAGSRLQVDVSLLAVVVLVFVAVGVAAVIYAIWVVLAERPTGNAPRVRRGWFHVVLALAAVGLLLALPERKAPPDEQPAPAEQIDEPARQPADDGPGPPVWPVVVLGAVFALAMVGAAVGGRRPRPAPDPEPPAEAPDRQVARTAFDASLDELEAEPDVRRAVIGAYASLLTGLERAGVPRHPDEAPQEHLERALGALDVPPAPMRALVALFQEARFSTHAMGAGDKAAAIDAFRAARASLGEPAVAR